MGELIKFLPQQLVGVAAAYHDGEIQAMVALVTLRHDDGLVLKFPKRNPFRTGDAITVHLDDRVGSEIFSIELTVYRGSYKGIVVRSEDLEIAVSPVDFELVYGTSIVASFRAGGYQHPTDTRPPRSLVVSSLLRPALTDEKEKSNKLGVLVTRALDRPHTTVMAFLSTVEDDIFLVTTKQTFKYHNLERDPRCVFALDHRAEFSFDRQVDWNYTIYEADAFQVTAPQTTSAVRAAFVEKNPWEEPFFSNPEAVVLHLKPRRILWQNGLISQ
jgi:hypothetical protein